MVELAFELFVNAVETIMVIYFLGAYNGYRYEGKKRNLFFCIGVMVSFVNVTVFDSITYFSEFVVITDFLICFGYCWLFLSGKARDKLLSCVLAGIGLIFINTFTLFLFSIITNMTVFDLVSKTNVYRIIVVVITKLALFAYYRYIIVLQKSLKNYYDNKYISLSLMIVPVVSFLIMALIMTIALNGSITLKDEIYTLFAIIGLVAINVLVFILYGKLCVAYELKMEAEIKAMQFKNIEDMRIAYESLKMLKHNIKNDMTVISNYIVLEEYGKALAVIRNVYDKVENIRSFVKTGNEMIDVLINAKIGEATVHGIHVQPIITTRGFCEMGCIDVYDAFTITGNLLDNAIEASKNNLNDKIIEIIIDEGNDIHITIKNTVDESVLKNNPHLFTTKKDRCNHGIGVKSIRKIVKKYDGILDIYEENNKFCVSIILNKIKQ